MRPIAIIGAGTQSCMLAFRCLAYGKRSPFSAGESAPVRRPWSKSGNTSRPMTDARASDSAVLKRLHVAKSLEEAVSGAELVIENIPELLKLKQQL